MNNINTITSSNSNFITSKNYGQIVGGGGGGTNNIDGAGGGSGEMGK